MPEPETAPSTTADAASKTRRLLEQNVPLSQSVIWGLQRDFYAQRGLKAWSEDLVPSYITNNPFIAEIFAEIVAAFVQDCMSSGLTRRSVTFATEPSAHFGARRRYR